MRPSFVRAADLAAGDIIFRNGYPVELLYNLQGATLGTRFLVWGYEAWESCTSPDDRLYRAVILTASHVMERPWVWSNGETGP
jgi:hypothetical protein